MAYGCNCSGHSLGGMSTSPQRTGPGGHCLDLVGQMLARLYSAMQIRQHGSGGCIEHRVSKGMAADAPAVLSAFLHS